MYPSYARGSDIFSPREDRNIVMERKSILFYVQIKVGEIDQYE